MNTINIRAARAAGYRAVTHGYDLPREQVMLDNVLADMRRGSIEHVLVTGGGGVAVWRRGRTRTGGSLRSGSRGPNGRSLPMSAATAAWRAAA